MEGKTSKIKEIAADTNVTLFCTSETKYSLDTFFVNEKFVPCGEGAEKYIFIAGKCNSYFFGLGEV